MERNLEGFLDDIDLALRANNGGGTEFRKDRCTCDASVGCCPCEYCAIDNALHRAQHLAREYVLVAQAVQVWKCRYEVQQVQVAAIVRARMDFSALINAPSIFCGDHSE